MSEQTECKNSKNCRRFWHFFVFSVLGISGLDESYPTIAQYLKLVLWFESY